MKAKRSLSEISRVDSDPLLKMASIRRRLGSQFVSGFGKEKMF